MAFNFPLQTRNRAIDSDINPSTRLLSPWQFLRFPRSRWFLTSQQMFLFCYMKQNICYRKIKPYTTNSMYLENPLVLLSICLFQSTLPSREETAIFTNFPDHSTVKIVHYLQFPWISQKNCSITSYKPPAYRFKNGAKLSQIDVIFLFALITLQVPLQDHILAGCRNVLPCFRTYFRGNRNADCLLPH